MARILDTDTKIVSLEPASLEEIVDNILIVGKVARREGYREEACSANVERIDRVKDKTQAINRRPRVFFMEWLQPPWVGGHWIPEMIEYPGGFDGLGHFGQPSYRIDWNQVVAYQPEIIVLSPCGFDAEQVVSESTVLSSFEGWEKIPAFQEGRLYAVNASAYFSRPGPRIVDGLEILAHVIQPELFPENPHPDAIKTVPRELILGNKAIQEIES